MQRAIRMSALYGVVAVVGLGGCAGERAVRYVYQDGQSGVIGMPENSSRWPTRYREHARELMAKHFPEGYEIVRAEEVVEGSRTLTINGSNSVELDPGSTGRLLSLGKLGRTSSRSQLDTVKIKECRIVYKKADPVAAPQHGDYAEQASWTPEPYLEHNPQGRIASGSDAEAAKDGKEGKEAEAEAKAQDAKVAETAVKKESKTPRSVESGESNGSEGRPIPRHRRRNGQAAGRARLATLGPAIAASQARPDFRSKSVVEMT